LTALTVAISGCADRPANGRSAGPSAPAAPAVSTPAAVDSAPIEPTGPLVVFLGDSLSAGYGLSEEDAFPAVIGERLAALGRPVRVVNAGVSGDTSAGGRARLDWLLRQNPDVLVVELGANDGLRDLPAAATEDNLRAIITTAKSRGIRVLLCGMQLPPNYGRDTTAAFAAIFPRLAGELDVALVPFLLEGVGGVPELNQADGIHPTVEGDRRVAETVLPHLLRVLDTLPATSAAGR
jgi:acyl-CoA thioesterase-1